MDEKPFWDFDVKTKAEAQAALVGENKVYITLPATEEDKAKVVRFYQSCEVPGYEVGSVEVIYNPSFHKGFEAQLSCLQQRSGNSAFAPKWDQMEGKKQRKELMEEWQELTNLHRDPKYPSVRLFPGWHGTREGSLDSIFKTGYANLSCTDKGFFGKGLYFTYQAEYAHRVYGNGKTENEGALLFNWVASFSVFPVIHGDESLLQANNNYENYDAHFVPVAPRNPNKLNETVYYSCKPGQKAQYHELVVFQNNACLPRYVVQLRSTLPKAPTAPTRTLENNKLEELKKVLRLAELCAAIETNSLKEAVEVGTWADENNHYELKLLKIDTTFLQTKLIFQSVYVFIANDFKKDIGLLDKLSHYYLEASKQIKNIFSNNSINNLDIVFTGFSIAGGLAQIAACYYKKTAITFESPGVKSIVHQIECNTENSNITNYLTVPNRINTFGEQLGRIRRIYISHVESTSNWHRVKAVCGEIDRISTYLMPFMLAHSYFFKTAMQGTVATNMLHVDKAAEILSAATKNSDKLFGAVISQAESSYKNCVSAYFLTQKNLKMAEEGLKQSSFFYTAYQAARQVRVISSYEKKELLDQGQHSIPRIFAALKENEEKIVSEPTKSGHIIEMQTWPKSLSKSVRAFFADIGRSYLPLQPSNAGIHNINDENSYIEGNIKLIEGYQPKI